MSKAPHAGGLFRSMGHKPHVKTPMRGDGTQKKPERRKDDFYPTPYEAYLAFIAAEIDRLKRLRKIWQPCAGDGVGIRALQYAGLDTVASDLVDRGCPDVELRSFYEYDQPLANAIVDNPPYCEISARDGHGKWLRHTRELGVEYAAYLLNWEWPAAKKNGFAEQLEKYPFARVYVCRWKIDFTGQGQAPQRNAWFVWDAEYKGKHPEFRFLDRKDPTQKVMKL